MAGIQFKDVIKRYGHGKHELQVIHGVNAEIADREFVVIAMQKWFVRGLVDAEK